MELDGWIAYHRPWKSRGERNKKGIFRLVNHGFAPVHNTTPACIAWEAREKMEKEVFHCKLSSIICSLFLHICMWCGSLLVMYLFIYSLITRKMLKPSNRNDSWMCFYLVSHHKNTLILILISPSQCRCSTLHVTDGMDHVLFFQKWRDSLHEKIYVM